MADEKLTIRTWFMIILAFAITILCIMATTALWRHSFREGAMFLALGGTLAFLFYRGKLALLAAAGCGWILVNAGLTAIFHPTTLGTLVTVASAVGMIFFLRRCKKLVQGIPPDDWQKVFDKK